MPAVLPVGQIVRVAGWRGVYRVHGIDTDGSYKLWGGPTGSESWRNAMPTKCRRVRKGGPERIPEMAAPTRRVGRR